MSLLKKEPVQTDEMPSTSVNPSLPALPTLEVEESPMKIIKKETDNSACISSSGASADLFGDVFGTKVESAKSSRERISRNCYLKGRRVSSTRL